MKPLLSERVEVGRDFSTEAGLAQRVVCGGGRGGGGWASARACGAKLQQQILTVNNWNRSVVNNWQR